MALSTEVDISTLSKPRDGLCLPSRKLLGRSSKRYENEIFLRYLLVVHPPLLELLLLVVPVPVLLLLLVQLLRLK